MSLLFVICERFKELSQNVRNYTEDIIGEHKMDACITLSTENPMDIVKYSTQKFDFPTINVYFLCLHRESYTKTFQMARLLRHNDPQCYLILISDSYVFCREVIKLHAEIFDYIKTPMQYDELQKSLLALYSSYKNQVFYVSDINNICVKSGSISYKLSKSEIIYIESYEQKLYIHTMDKTIECFGYLKDMEKELNKFEQQFYRCHRSFLINISRIKEVNYKEMCIEMMNGQKCYCSRQNKKELKEILFSKQ